MACRVSFRHYFLIFFFSLLLFVRKFSSISFRVSCNINRDPLSGVFIIPLFHYYNVDYFYGRNERKIQYPLDCGLNLV
jgi:hypothetical protein